MRLEPLSNAYTQQELMGEMRSTYKKLRKADRQATRVYPEHYDILVRDQAHQPGHVSQSLPMMFGDVLVDAKIEAGLWKNSFFVVIRPNDHQIIIRQGSYSKLLSPVTFAQLEEVVIPAGQMAPQYANHQQAPWHCLGTHWAQEPLAELDSTPEDQSQARERMADMIARAKALVGEGGNQGWGFRQRPLWDPSNEPQHNAY
ncbi:hypothetical protein IV102_11040 [bacterium]|nr:hypothetical protein [bacterium]